MKNLGELIGMSFAPVEQPLSTRDAILYALGVGFGQDPTDREQLRFVYEERLKTVPTMAVVLGSPGFWLREPQYGVDWKQVLHGEQGVELHGEVPHTGTAVGETTILDVLDKGPGKGAFIYWRNRLTHKETGRHFATLTSTAICRGNGGFGGNPGTRQPMPPFPDRAPDAVWDFKTIDQVALLYRLNGDDNPLHADPDVAIAAGFPRPILHGLCAFGIAGHALLRECCGYDTTRFRSMKVRFSSPVFPGERLRTEIWNEGHAVFFRCLVPERGVIAIDRGTAQLGPAAMEATGRPGDRDQRSKDIGKSE